tara:strand:+ start:55091 stop:55801 length:711 start_codon:yes stop_codon:yes gene_type:complete
MTEHCNSLGQPIGAPVPEWKPVERPPITAMTGRHCRLEPVNVQRHASELFEAFSADRENRVWTYLPYGPFGSEAALADWMVATCMGDDPLFHAIIDKASGKAVGVASFLRIDPINGSIEVGHINYSPLLQKTPAATEAMFLLMRRVFSQLGYRRYEWKCDALNAGSQRAARRLGFQFEGIFRQATIYKRRNRDTAWFSIVDKEWPQLEAAFEQWLCPDNFDAQGRQKQSLASFTAT